LADSKVFKLFEGIDVESVGRAVEGFLRDKKNLQVESMKTAEGYLVQAKQSDGWKKFVGMDSAIQVQIFATGDFATVNIGQGKWIDKAGAATLGMLVFAPLAITAAFGAVAQKKLPEEIFNYVEQFLMSGGRMVTHSMSASIGLKENQILCPSCKTSNPETGKFCVSCGSKMGLQCPGCQATVAHGTKFCPECGTSMNEKIKCAGCSHELEANAKFCPECGTPR